MGAYSIEIVQGSKTERTVGKDDSQKLTQNLDTGLQNLSSRSLIAINQKTKLPEHSPLSHVHCLTCTICGRRWMGGAGCRVTWHNRSLVGHGVWGPGRDEDYADADRVASPPTQVAGPPRPRARLGCSVYRFMSFRSLEFLWLCSMFAQLYIKFVPE